MKKYVFIGVITSVLLFMALTVFAGWGFEPSSWDTVDRVFWSLFLIVFIIGGAIIGNIVYSEFGEE